MRYSSWLRDLIAKIFGKYLSKKLEICLAMCRCEILEGRIGTIAPAGNQSLCAHGPANALEDYLATSAIRKCQPVVFVVGRKGSMRHCHGKVVLAVTDLIDDRVHVEKIGVRDVNLRLSR